MGAGQRHRPHARHNGSDLPEGCRKELCHAQRIGADERGGGFGSSALSRHCPDTVPTLSRHCLSACHPYRASPPHHCTCGLRARHRHRHRPRTHSTQPKSHKPFHRSTAPWPDYTGPPSVLWQRRDYLRTVRMIHPDKTSSAGLPPGMCRVDTKNLYYHY